MLHLAQILVWIGVPLLVASFLAHMVRLPQFTKRIALVVYALVFALVGLFPLSDAFRPGIDLSGGTILVYEVEKPTPAGFDINSMVSAIQRRIDPVGLMDVTIRPVGADQVEFVIPRAKPEDVARCKRILTSVGSLEFRILANQRDHASLIKAADASFPRPLESQGKVLARWLPIAASAEPLTEHGAIVVRSDPIQGNMVLAIADEFDVTGELLRRAEPTVDDYGRPAVEFHFGPVGALRFAALTKMNLPDSDGFERRLAIVLDGKVHSAPNIRDRISENGIITGDFSKQEVDDLAAVLNAGSLPASLQSTPASELNIGPTLGRDTVRSGLVAVAVATAAVLAFMAFYYRLAGLVADLAVVLNVLIVVGVMSWIRATWTLPGLAGLALSVGMAVDANVLIFERLREEQQRARSLRLAVDFAFERALRPILDSNVTTLLAGAVLYWLGSEQVKGFALTLVIGLVANLFTAVFVCRLVFDVLERNAWVKRFGMFRLFEQARFDFVGKRWIAVAGSSALVIMGITAVLVRGTNLFDIDFTGGTLAAVTFEKPTNSAAVRAAASQVLPDVAVEDLQLSGSPPGHHFLLRTTLQNQEDVKTRLMRQFQNTLATTRMKVESVEPLAVAGKVNAEQGTLADPKRATSELAANTAVPPSTDTKQSQAGTPKTAQGQTQPNAEGGRQISNLPSPIPNPPAGGSRVILSFNRPIRLEAIEVPLEDYLARHGFTPARQHYRIAAADQQNAALGQKVRLETTLDGSALRQMLQTLGDEIARTTVFERLDNFGGQVAKAAQVAAGLALLASMVAIVVYLWIRFQNVLFGLGAVIALVHDVLVVLGLVAASYWVAGSLPADWLALESFKINLPMVAALLTLVGYSVNDTIVVFDRIREIRRKTETITWKMINAAVNQTLSRTLLTSLTTWVVALILYAFGGPAIHGFAFCLVLGVLVGTYSSIYIASPLLIWLSHARKQPLPSATPMPPASHREPGKEPQEVPQRTHPPKHGRRGKKKAA